MKPRKQIFIYLINPKLYLFFFFNAFILNSNVFAQGSLKSHLRLVEASKISKNACISRDTLYCSGMAIAQVKTSNGNQDRIIEEAFLPIGSNVPVLFVNRIQINHPSSEPYTLHHYEFPDIALSCYLKVKTIKTQPYDRICKSGLINAFGLDTLKAEIFKTIYGINMNDSGIHSKMAGFDKNISLITVRDTTAMVLIEGENIAQDGVLIGTVELDTMNGPHGLITQIKVLNAIGAIICTAVKNNCQPIEEGLSCFSLLTYKDHRFYSMKSNSRNHVKSIIEYLIEHHFL